jgi:hypothetical protein
MPELFPEFSPTTANVILDFLASIDHHQPTDVEYWEFDHLFYRTRKLPEFLELAKEVRHARNQTADVR